MDAKYRSVIFARTSDVFADGEIVWSWRPDAGVKLAMMLRITPTTVANKPGSPRRSRISRKTIAQGMPVVSAEPVVLPRAFFVARGPWVQRAPGIPCALFISMGASRDKNSDAPRRENVFLYLSPRRPCESIAKAGTHNQRRMLLSQAGATIATTTSAGGYGSPRSRRVRGDDE